MRGLTLLAIALAQEYLTAGGVPLTGHAATSLEEPSFCITKQVDEVNLVFTVTDSKRRLRGDLSSADFLLFDNHRAAGKNPLFPAAEFVTLTNRSAGSSITGRFGFEKKAADVFLKKMLRPGVDQAFLVAFNDEVHLLHDFTDNVLALRESLKVLKPGGDTALYDAIVFAAEKLRPIRNPPSPAA